MVGAAAVTVIAAVPVCPSLVAVMVTGPPAVTPVTSPVDETVAMAALLVVHVTVRPVSTFPAASVVVAVNCTVAPTFTVAVPGLTDTDVTGAAVAVTVIAAVPLCPSLVAVIVTGPPAVTPVTSPVDETVATAALLVVHVTVRPVSTFPAASCVVAVSCTVAPTATAAGVGVTVTDATGAGAVTVIGTRGSIPPNHKPDPGPALGIAIPPDWLFTMPVVPIATNTWSLPAAKVFAGTVFDVVPIGSSRGPPPPVPVGAG